MSGKPSVAILGGTGDLGSGLAKRWLAAGYDVTIGSRSAEKAQAFAKELGAGARGDDNVGAAKAADIVVVAVPFSNHEATLLEVKDAVQGKIVVDENPSGSVDYGHANGQFLDVVLAAHGCKPVQ